MYSLPLTIKLSNGKTDSVTGTLLASEAYDDGKEYGKSLVDVSTTSMGEKSYSNKTYSIPFTVKLTNGAVYLTSLSINANAAYDDGKAQGKKDADAAYSHYGSTTLYYKNDKGEYVGMSHDWYFK